MAVLEELSDGGADGGADAGAGEAVETIADAVARMKDIGNASYAREAYAEAMAAYGDAIEACGRAGDGVGVGDDDDGRGRRLAILYGNRAACAMKLRRFEACVEDCDRAIEADSGYVKAWFRRARAREAMDDLEGALGDYEKAAALGEPSAAREARRTQPLAEKRREEMKEEMIGKMKELGNSLLGNFGLSLDNFKAQKDEKTGSYSIQFVQGEGDARARAGAYDEDEDE